MKKYLFILLAGCLGIAACDIATNKVKDFIPGSYVSSAQSEFSIANDTLVISADPEAVNIYTITRKTGYRLLVNGKPTALHHKVKRYTATYNKDSGLLTVLQTGKVIRFVPDKQMLINGNSQYRKL